MLYTYPSNRLENLVAALETLLSHVERPVLAADPILVQHPGMQHWLSMALAKRSKHQLCMNAEFPLPVRYFWDLIRLILGPGVVPERSVYSREILVWRIYQLLVSPDVVGSDLCAEPTSYWQDQPVHLQTRRRYQLAEQLADLFEQYLMFRPEWIEQWEQSAPEHWQALIWKALVAQDANHPLRLMRLATAQLKNPAQPLPRHFFLFGINTLAPIWLDFLTHLSEQTKTDIHLLYLNPSAEHWDELQTEKQRIQQLLKQSKVSDGQSRAQWLQTDDDEYWKAQAANPLLTSLGQQGQAFVRLLSDQAHYDTHIFTEPEQSTLLNHLQRDLLTATDGREQPKSLSIDSSITVTSAHSAFREVQGLHDWLLHQFNEDENLTPKDVLVMCPNVEDYAPFVQAVFSRGFSDHADNTPPLPCSIADRNLKDADPTVAAFLELLTLPDARFEVSQIVSWLRVPAIAHKFGLTTDNLQTLSRWLSRANVHWGLDANHKKQWLDTNPTSHFTWQQGLDRLLLGFAFGDEDALVDDIAFMHDVEGVDAVLLGKLTQIIEQLQQVRSDLTKDRTPGQWQSYLIDQLQIALLSTDSEFERSNQSILKAINDFTEFAHKAQMHETNIPLSVVRHVFDNAFASPDQTGSQFMAGQITVCSMVPMRSIPFKVVAILGLNDGQFPRSRPPLGFDLMAQDKPRLGDRSRRGDDRYLFLEALLSARESLYLSYQGFDIHKNEKRPPSLVLEELFDYLGRAYGFDKECDIRTLPLQPFSPKNYEGDFPSFDARWVNMNRTVQTSFQPLPALADIKNEWQLSEWINFLTHPSKYFAQQRLGLFLGYDNRDALEDTEPFDLTHLDRYQIQSLTVTELLDQGEHSDLVKQQLATSAWPVNNQVADQVTQWQADASEFTNILKQLGADTVENHHQILELGSLELTADLPLNAKGELLRWRLANPKGKDVIDLWLHHLVANSIKPVHSVGLFRGAKETYSVIRCEPVAHAKNLLEQVYLLLIEGLSEPLFLNGDLLISLLNGKDDEVTYNKMWDDTYNQRGLRYDDYIQYFWQQCPDYELTMSRLQSFYEPLLAHCVIATWESDDE